MARKPKMDERQAALPDFPASSLPSPSAPPPPRATKNASSSPKSRRETESRPPPPDNQNLPVDSDRGTGSLATPLSPAPLSLAELDELTIGLTDEALAHLVLTAVRQMRRRLARGGGRPGKNHQSILGRAAQRLASELGNTHGDEDA